ncbi:neuronal acetylcholine receptor subunit alpha-9-like [Ciona intestinalis]
MKNQLLVAILCLVLPDVKTSKTHDEITDTPYQLPNTSYVERHVSELDHDHIGNYSNPNNENSIKKLYYDLFIRRGYDKAVRPVQNASDQVQIQLDFSYVQVLNLNEKDQILKSLLRTRIYWTDEFLMWTPSEYNGQTSLLVKSTDVWIPDVVMDEEVGLYDYSPRLPFLFVEHTGLVGLLQPSSFETSCRVNIAYFPFDVQECQFIFTTWTFPTSKADLIAKREVEDMNKDVEEYFVATGEWLMEELRVTKASISYADVVISSTTPEAGARSATLGPNEWIKDVYPERLLDNHWSELKFTLKFRRNSSLYMQSMLFPAILLTTVSLLGFYLPPDSGERIGLQITIMLTFMVFLLTVGDMFPASTGPYLGVYFVLCMALLGINIIMTVLVLHIHHMPCDAVMEEMKTKGVFTVNFKAVPAWIRVCLFLSGQYPTLKNFTVTEEKVEVVQKKETTGSIIKLLWQRCKTVVLKSMKRSIGVGGRVVGDQSCHTCNDPIEDCKHASPCAQGHDGKEQQSYEGTDKETTNADVNADAQTDYVFINVFSDILSDMSKLSGYVTGLSEYMQYSNTDLKENRLSGAMEEKWKSVARSVDTVCLWVYIAALVVFHIGMFIAVVISAFSKET